MYLKDEIKTSMTTEPGFEPGDELGIGPELGTESTQLAVSKQRPMRTGEYILDYLLTHGSASPSVMHKEYKAYSRQFRTQKRRKYHVATYHSFIVYVNGLVRSGLLEKSSRTSLSTDPKGDPLDEPDLRRRNVRLTDKGKGAPPTVWSHPNRLYYDPFDWERDNFPEFIKE